MCHPLFEAVLRNLEPRYHGVEVTSTFVLATPNLGLIEVARLSDAITAIHAGEQPCAGHVQSGGCRADVEAVLAQHTDDGVVADRGRCSIALPRRRMRLVRWPVLAARQQAIERWVDLNLACPAA